jgi:uncharacterized protein involved in copper resistance
MKSFALISICVVLLGGCATQPPPAPNRSTPDPSDPTAPQASARPLHPNLVATTKVYLDPSLGQEAQKMEHGNMQGMDHSKMPGMTSQPQNKEILEKEMQKTSDVTYTCVMHPEVKSDKPDNCPKCGMKLAPKPAAQ